VRRTARDRGGPAVARDCAVWGAEWAIGRWRRPAPFHFDGREYLTLHHPYRFTWLNERAVEVPVFRRLVEEASGSVLEVGNVLSHYMPCRHDVVDKYEAAEGVVSADVLEFEPESRYRLIISISTLEHVGFDERSRDPEKPLRAVERLRSLLEPGGRLVFSLPVGYNPDLDRRVREGALDLDQCGGLRRERRRWREVSCHEAWDAPYDELLYRASGVVISTVAT
jgi:SAM-dependent methyltransferase